MASTLCFSLLIFLSSLSLVCSQYVLPDRYFINCGSRSDIDFTGRKFVGDVNPSGFSISGGQVAAENNNPATNTPSIYRTARVFTKKSWYELNADENNTFVMVRLHFSPFASNEFEFSNAKLDVSVAGFSLLSGFTVGNATVIRELIFLIGSDRSFRIDFTPSGSSSFAFVNAIEAFTTPSDLFTAGASFPHISPAGNIGDFENLTSDYAFNPIHRVNIGGEAISVDRDTLRRTWTTDDSFIYSNQPATNANTDGRINYIEGGASPSDAPDNVYNTAKQLNNTQVNITWNFDVNKNAMYLIRAHFCDIISRTPDSPTDAFNFFIYSQFRERIVLVDKVRTLLTPFYIDFVVDSADSDRLNISIGAIRGNSQPAFLNGVEIMELLRNSGVTETNGKKGNSIFIVIGCVVAGVAFLLALLAGFFIRSRCRKQKQVAAGAKMESDHVVPSYGRSSYTSINIDFTVNHPSPKLDLNLRYPLADISQATNNFDEKLMIGSGGFGKVYKATLYGKKVAVKRGGEDHGQGRPEFVTEIMVLSQIRHRHLVSLHGYCDENSEMILVYEFMEKGTLQDHLYGDKDHPKLSWERRLEICISAARGLHYLHTGSEGGIIHRDVKSTNILLNEKYVAKVADFGISRLDNVDVVDEGEMSYVKGSFGYLDPEYVRCMKLTQKSDVYSFGVVLLEVLCARPALDHSRPSKEVNLAGWAIKHIKNGNVQRIIDPFIVDTINPDSLRKFVEIVEKCLKDTGDERPSMVDVLWDLEYVLKFQSMSVDTYTGDDSTFNTSLQLPMSVIDRLPSQVDDDYDVNDNSVSSYPSESQVFSQLKMDEAR